MVILQKHITVGEILHIFRDYGVTLLAGEQGLGDAVSSISVLELNAASQNPAWFLGGEFVLSTLQMCATPQETADTIRVLAARGVTALGAHQVAEGRKFSGLMIDAADSLGFPVLFIPCDVPYSVLFTAVYERLFSQSTEGESERQYLLEDFYNDLLNGRERVPEAMEARASRLGLDYESLHCAAEVRIENCSSHIALQLCKEALEVCSGSFEGVAVSGGEGCLLALRFPDGESGKSTESVRALYLFVSGAAVGLPGNPSVYMGVGTPGGLLSRLFESREEAGRAVCIGRRRGEGGLFFFDRLGVYSLLDMDSVEEFHGRCKNGITAFESLLGERAIQYLDTLEVYFDAGESLAATARALFIHVNTVKYRLRRIRELLGEDLFRDGVEKQRVYLLLKIRRLL